MLKHLIVFTVSMVVLGCDSREPSASLELFDTALFFKQQVALLQREDCKLIKVLSFGEKKDSVFVRMLDWDKELAAFKDIDLRKSAYAGRFNVDSSSIQSEHITHYYRIDSTTNLKDVWIHRQNNSVTRIVFVMAENNELYQSQKRMVYNTGIGFEISGNQLVRFNGSFSYQVNGYFTKTNVNR